MQLFISDSLTEAEWGVWGGMGLCDNHDATLAVLLSLGLDVTSASFELHRGVSEAGQRTCVTALM